MACIPVRICTVEDERKHDWGIGISFIEVAFVENVAQIGGGVHSTGSGTEVTTNNPMTFDRCKFVGNNAFATGGAIDSASGQDVFLHTSFEGNKARVGGALRLAGIASIDNCSFEENVSEFGGGPAVFNSGYMSNVTNSYFYHNIFKCGAQEFLHFNEARLPFTLACRSSYYVSLIVCYGISVDARMCSFINCTIDCNNSNVMVTSYCVLRQ